jgi:hypothetical protein
MSSIEKPKEIPPLASPSNHQCSRSCVTPVSEVISVGWVLTSIVSMVFSLSLYIKHNAWNTVFIYVMLRELHCWTCAYVTQHTTACCSI